MAPSPLKTPGSDGRLLRDSIMHRSTRAKHSGGPVVKSHSAPLSPTTFHTPGVVVTGGYSLTSGTPLHSSSLASAVKDMSLDVFATPAAHLSAPFPPSSPDPTLEEKPHDGLSADAVLSAGEQDGQAAEAAAAEAAQACNDDAHTMRKSQSMNSLLSAMTASVLPPSSPPKTSTVNDAPAAASPAASSIAPASALSPACPPSSVALCCSPMPSVVSMEEAQGQGQGSAPRSNSSARRFSDVGSPHQSSAHRPLLSVAEREEAKRRIRMNVNVPGLGWPFMLASNANAAPKAKQPQKPKRRALEGDADADAEHAEEGQEVCCTRTRRVHNSKPPLGEKGPSPTGR